MREDGGLRGGGGFKPGHKKTGGRKAGVPNRATAKREAEIAKSGLTPLEVMLKIMRNKNKTDEQRLDAAKAAAPYVHPKLAAIEHFNPDGTALVPTISLIIDGNAVSAPS